MRSWGLDQTQALGRMARNDRHNAALVQQTRDRAHWLVRA
jgi:hypothetical protein